jgi:hypothetical protein
VVRGGSGEGYSLNLSPFQGLCKVAKLLSKEGLTARCRQAKSENDLKRPSNSEQNWVTGIYRNGKVELAELPPQMGENARVIVTFLGTGEVDLAAQGISTEQAAELRARLQTFAEDWDSPEMSIYDDYDANKAK